MAVQNYIGWATGVNRIVLDTSSITVGENALKTDELESGGKRSIQKRAYVPDTFSVSMSFDWVNNVYINGIDTGKTEYQLFIEWYKYAHKYGSVPFEFPKIIYSQNTGINIYDTVDHGNKDVEYYKITNAVQGSKSGEHVQVTMNWETVYGGEVSIAPSVPAVVGIQATKDYVDIFFSLVSETAPVSTQFTVYLGNNVLTKTGFCYDGDKTVRIYYDEINSGTVSIAIDNYSGLNVTKGTYTSEV